MCGLREKEKQVIFLGVILLDQISKALALSQKVGFLNFGSAWGIFPAVPRLISVLAVFFVLILYFRIRDNRGLALVVAGGVANLIDRVIRGGVVDFINLWIFPAFNLADLAIFVGIILILIDALRSKKVR